MSLEKAIEQLTQVLEKNNELLELNLAAREELAKAAGKIGKAEKTEKADKKSKKSRDEDEGDEDDRPAKKSDKKGKTSKPKPQKKVTGEELDNIYGELLSVKDKKLYKENEQFVQAVVDELGVDSVSEIEKKDFVRAHYWAQQKLAGVDTIDFDEEIESDDDEDEDERPAKKDKKEKKKSRRDDDDDDDEDSDDED